MTTAQASIDQAPSGTSRSATAGQSKQEIERILGLNVPVSVTLADRDMAVESLLAIRVGTIIEFDVLFDSELTLHVADQPIAKGHAVKIGENFGLRVNRVNGIQDRIEAMGAGSLSP